jgi:hypothetical protein
VWSAPATVEVVATPDTAGPAASRIINLPPGACPRAPDGTCINRQPMVSPTCPRIGPDYQCLPAGPGSLPGVVGAPAAPGPDPATAGLCTQHDAANRCVAYSGTNTVGATHLTLRVEISGGMARLSWTPVSGALVYELFRCNAATSQSCTSLAVLSTTSHQVLRTTEGWYRVEARNATGQVLTTSNFVGPT